MNAKKLVSSNHLQTIDQKHTPYKTEPPTSGPHFIQAAEWGISQLEIPDDQFVHNLEHGGIVITYKPGLDKAKIDELKNIATNLTTSDKQKPNKGFKVLLTPRAKNKQVVVGSTNN